MATVWFGVSGGQTFVTNYGHATGVDDNSDVVGWHRTGPGAPQIAFIWSRQTGIRDLPGLYPNGASAAVAINGTIHQILGWAIDASGVKHVVIWKGF
jgi:hypothetical protein